MNLSILLLEDNVDDQALFKRNLNKTSFNYAVVTIVETVADALRFLQKNEVDITFVDFNLPDCEGIEVLSQVVRNKRAASVIVLTGNEDLRLLENSSQFEISDFLVKSEINVKNLERAIRYSLSWRKFQIEKSEVESQLHRAMRMETIGRFAGGIAHDLNNKLAIVTANIDLLASCKDDQQLFDKRVNSIKNAICLSVTLLKQLLAFGRGQELQKESVDLRHWIGKSINLIRPLIRSDIDLAIEMPDEELISFVDVGQLDQVITNLVANSKDAIGEKSGKILVRLEVADSSDLVCFKDQTCFKEYNKLSVIDSGKGMTSEEKQRAMEPFFTTKDLGQGTGLGLSVVDGIISQHNGFIKIEDNFPVGTAIRLYFPRFTKNKDILTNIESAQEEIPEVINGTILLVDDETDLRDVTAKLLQSKGLKVIEAEDGQMASEIYEKYKEEINLIITDIIMPNMSGVQLADKIRLSGATVPIIFISGYSKKELTRRDEQLTSNCTSLEKPFDFKLLYSTVFKMLKSKTLNE